MVDFLVACMSTHGRARSLVRSSLFISEPCRSVVVAQNPGRVVTLVHQEDWANFSGAVSFRSHCFCLAQSRIHFE